MKLKISESFSLPLELATGSIAMLAIKGSGKTYTSAVLTDAYPEEVGKHDVAGASGYEASGGGFNNALGRLRTLGIIVGFNPIKASDSLFP